MFCESCGSLIPDGHSFCSNCGTPVSRPQVQPAQAAPAPVAAAPVVAAPAPAAQPVQPVYQQPAVQPVQPVYQPVAQPVQPVYQQPVYQQPVYQQAPAAPVKRGNGPATAGLVFGILTMVFCWIPGIFWGFALFGLIFSIIGVAKRNASGKGKAIAGLILTVLGLIFGIVIQETFWTMVGKEFEKEFNSALETLYDTNYSNNDANSFFIDGDFVNTDDGYVSGVLHIDGYRVDF